MYSDTSFNTLVPALEQVLKGAGKLDGKEQSVLVQGGYEGLSSVWLSNKLLQHGESYMQIVSRFKNQNEANICAFNTYFSKYYYKLNIVPVQDNTLLKQAVNDPDIRFDIIFSDDNITHDGILQWNLLKNDGILIINGGDSTAVENIIKAVNPIVLYKDKFIVLKKI